MPVPRPNSTAPARVRRSAALAAAAVVLAVLLFAAGRWLPRWSSALEADPRGAHPVALVREATDAQQGTDEARAADARARARASARAADDVAAATQPATESRAEPATLVGRVVDRDGRPLQAVVVVAEGGGYRIPIELDELVEQCDEFETERTHTDADGRFRFGAELDLSQGVALYASAEGYVPFRLDRLPLEASTTAEGTIECGELRLARGATARGRVVDRAGNAVPGAEVRLALVSGEQTFEMDVRGRGVLVATAGAEGEFALDGLAPGPLTLLVDAPGFVTARATGVVASDTLDLPQIALEAGARLAGQIVGRAPSADDLYAALWVELRPGAHSEGSVSDPRTRDQRMRSAIVGADGAFEVAGLLPDMAHTLIVKAQQPDGRTLRAPEVLALTIEPATRRVEVPWRTLGSATLRVVDAATGAPIERFGIGWCAVAARPQQAPALEDDEDWNEGAPTEWQALPADDGDEASAEHPDGRVHLRRLAPIGDLMALEVELVAPGYDRHSFTAPTCAAGHGLDLGEVRLKPRPEVRVHVRRAVDGAPVAGSKVIIVRAGEDDLARWLASDRRPLFEDVSSGVTDAEGTALLRSLPGARVVVGAAVPRGSVVRPLELVLSNAGGEELTLEVAAGARLVVQVSDRDQSPAPDVVVICRPVSLAPHDPHEPLVRSTDRAGTATIEGLAAGRYEVAAASHDFKAIEPEWRSVVLEVGQTERMSLEAPTRAFVVGRATEGGAPLAGARVVLQVPLQPGQRLEADDGDWGGYEVCECVSKADGTFLLGPVVPGELEVVVHHIERAMPVSVGVTVRAGVNRVDVSLPVTSLEGRLVDHDKEPWVDAWVELIDPEASSSNYDYVPGLSETPTGDVQYDSRETGSGQCTTDAEGRFHFRGVSAGRTLTLHAGADSMEPLMVEVPPLGDGDHRDVGTLVSAVFGELVLTLASRPTAPCALKLFDAERDIELVERGLTLGVDDDLPSWSLARGRYRVELHDPARPGEPRSAEAVVEPRLQTILALP